MDTSEHQKSNIQLTIAIPLPEIERKHIRALAERILAKHRGDFKSFLLHVYVKNANGRVGCSANLFTDNGRYHAYAEEWGTRKSVSYALDALHEQILKHFERLAPHLRIQLHA